MRINDGEGSGREAGVTAQLEVKTRARTITQEDSEVLDGNLYIVLSDVRPLTSAGEQGILYLLNTSDAQSILLHRAFSGGEGAQIWRAYTNPTGGTLISEASLAIIANANLQSGNTLAGNAYRNAADGKTVTGGSLILCWITGAGIPADVAGGTVILGPGDAVALTVEAAAAGDYSLSMLVTQEDLS